MLVQRVVTPINQALPDIKPRTPVGSLQRCRYQGLRSHYPARMGAAGCGGQPPRPEGRGLQRSIASLL